MAPNRRQFLFRYGLALASTLLATWLRLVIEPHLLDQVPFVTYFPAVFITALYGRIGPTLLSVALSSLAAAHYFIPPSDTIIPNDAAGWTSLLLFAFFGVAIAILSERMHRNSQQALQESEQHAVTLSSIGDAVIVTDSDDNVTFLNEVAEKLTGWKQDEAIGKPLCEVFHIVNEQTRNPVESPSTRAIRDGAIVGLANHTVLISRDGIERPIDDSASPIRAHDSNVLGCVLVFHDVTKRRAADRALRESEEQLRLIANALPALIAYIDSEQHYQWTNQPYAEQFRQNVDEIVDQPVRQVVGEETYREIQPRLESALTGKEQAYELELPMPNSDEVRVKEVTYIPHQSSEGDVLGCFVLVLDVTERRRDENMHARLAAIINSSEDAIIGKTLDGVVTSWNRAAESLYGYASDEMFGQSIFRLFPPDRTDEFRDIFARLRRGEPIEQLETQRVCKDGSRRQVSLTISPIKNSREQFVGASTIARDIGERKRLENELRQVAADLSRASQRKDEFLATLAHELRNPLAPIRTGLEVLKMIGNDPERFEEVRATMERQTQQLTTLVDDLMNVSRITRGKLELRKTRVNLSDILESAVEASQPFIDEACHKLTISLPERTIHLDADPHRLAQVFSNLLNNAAKYTPEAGHIQLTAECHGSEAVVSVTDNGIGIVANMLQRVFEMFAQIEKPSDKDYTGLGIGLTLVRSLVEMHGGSVEVHSEGPNQGSTFRIRLPVLADVPIGEQPSVIQTNSVALPKRRVLVVDDNRDAADMLRAILEMEGSEVETASDGREAIQAAAEFQPEIVLMDIGMPTMNGYEAARHIRQQPWGKKMLLVAVTGWGQDEDRKSTSEAGFDYNVVKPIDLSVLEQILKNAE